MELKSIISWSLCLLFGATGFIGLLSYWFSRAGSKERKTTNLKEGTKGPFTVTISDDVKTEKVTHRGNAQPFVFTTTNYSRPQPSSHRSIEAEHRVRNSAERMVVMYAGNTVPERFYNKRYYMPDSSAS